jgi:DNA polymerase-4
MTIAKSPRTAWRKRSRRKPLVLWPLCERVSARLKQASLAADTVTLKLKTANFRLRTRSRRLPDPTQLAATLFGTAASLLAAEADGVTRYRLIGVGADRLSDRRIADPPILFDRELDGPTRLEHAIDDIRTRLGEGSVGFGCDLPTPNTRTDLYNRLRARRKAVD